MKLQFIQPQAELKPYIHQFWLFESEHGMATHGTLIAPNGKPKIIIPYKNALTTTGRKGTAICKESDICFIGIRDEHVTLGSAPGSTGCIGIELTTTGGYRFSNISMSSIANGLCSFHDLYGQLGRQLLDQVANYENPWDKVNAIQVFLWRQLMQNQRENGIVDYAVNAISASGGMVGIKTLEQKTGYSKRYLDMLFKQYLGISPKTYSTIVRFQRFYKAMSFAGADHSNKNELYDLYYDQSHFIREFKRYTGLSPQRYVSLNNDFGKYF